MGHIDLRFHSDLFPFQLMIYLMINFSVLYISANVLYIETNLDRQLGS